MFLSKCKLIMPPEKILQWLPDARGTSRALTAHPPRPLESHSRSHLPAFACAGPSACPALPATFAVLDRTHPSSHLPQTPPPPLRSLPGPLVTAETKGSPELKIHHILSRRLRGQGPCCSLKLPHPQLCVWPIAVLSKHVWHELRLPLLMTPCVRPRGGGSVAFLHTDAHPFRIFSLATQQGQALARQPCPQFRPA